MCEITQPPFGEDAIVMLVKFGFEL